MTAPAIPVRINRNENAWGCSPAVLNRLATLTTEDIARYPDDTPLQAELARFLGMPVEQVRITAAGDEAIRMVIDGLTREGDTVVIPEPEFPIFRWCAQTRNRAVRTVPLDRDYNYDVQAILKAAAGADLLVLMSPHNPAGCALDTDDMETILQALPDTPVLLDEAYGEFDSLTGAGLVGRYPNLLVLKTFSKAFGLAGLRLGALLGQSGILGRASDAQMPYAVGSVSVAAGLAALSDPGFTRTVRFGVRRNRTRIRAALGRLGIPTLPSRANFVPAWFGPDAPAIQARLKDRGVQVRDIGREHRMPGWLRFTVGTGDELDRALDAVSDLVAPGAVLFDMDGVLVDVRDSYHAAIRETVRELTGVPATDSEIRALKATGGFNCDWALTTRLVANRTGDADRESVVRTFQQLFRGNGMDGLIQRDRLLVHPDMLDRLATRYRLGVVTGRPAEEAAFTLERFGLARFFPAVVSRDDIPEDRGKPEPDGLLMAMDRAGETRAIYLGDTVDDMRAALRARLVPVGVALNDGGRRQRRTLQLAGAVAVLPGINQLEEWINEKGIY